MWPHLGQRACADDRGRALGRCARTLGPAGAGAQGAGHPRAKARGNREGRGKRTGRLAPLRGSGRFAWPWTLTSTLFPFMHADG